MIRSGQRDLENLRSLFSEMGRIQLAFADKDYRPDPDSLFCGIADPAGRGHIPIGRQGMAMLTELAVSAIKAAGLEGRVSEATARDTLGPILLRTFKKEKIPITLLALQKTYGETAKSMRIALRSRTFLIPCHLVDTAEPEEIRLGPVTFLNRAAFRRLFRSAAPARSDTAWKGEDRRLLAQAMRHYRGYRWVAAVRIDDCEAELAKDYAAKAAELALSGLQLFFGARAAGRMAIGGGPQGWQREAELQITETGEFAITISQAFKSGAGFEKGWSTELDHTGMRRGMNLCGVALEAAFPGLKRPLSDRVLGAIQWYGEAVRDVSPATRLIKFMTAVEHIVLTGEKIGVTPLMAQRVSALVYEIGSGASRQEVRKEFLRLYALRSKLVHGSVSPWEPEIRRNLAAAADLAEQVIHSALSEWGADGLQSARATAPRMRSWYHEIVWQMILDTELVAHVDAWMRERASQAWHRPHRAAHEQI